MKKTTKINGKNIRKAYLTLITVLSSISLMMMTASANASYNTKPGGLSDNGFMTATIAVVFWAVRILIGFFGVQGGIKVAQAQAEEDARGRNAGIVTLGVCGVMFAVTFMIESAIK